MVNGASRRSHDSKDELGGKPTSVWAYAGERLSLTGLGKALQGKPRSKPESGNPTFRDCRGAPGNVAHGGARLPRCNRKGSDGHSPPNGVARPDSIPTPGTGSFRAVTIEAAVEVTKPLKPSVKKVAKATW